jgi:predicted RNase H-like HicB family nuclease
MAKTYKELQFKVLIEQDEDGIYVASVPELPGCYTQGKTLEEVRKRIKEVIALVLETDEDLKQEKLESPKPSSHFFGIEEVTIRSYGVTPPERCNSLATFTPTLFQRRVYLSSMNLQLCEKLATIL